MIERIGNQIKRGSEVNMRKKLKGKIGQRNKLEEIWSIMLSERLALMLEMWVLEKKKIKNGKKKGCDRFFTFL